MLRPQRLHHRVERHPIVGLAAGGLATQVQVERERHERAFGVVADSGVGAVLVGPVVLDPGIQTGVLEGLDTVPGHAVDAADGLGEQLEVGGRVDHAGAQQREVVVVGGEALEQPELTGQVLAREVVGREVRRLDALDQPAVEVLVAEQTEQGVVALVVMAAGARQVVALEDQAGAGAVLEPAIAAAGGEAEEVVARERRLATEQADLPFADLLHVGSEAGEVGVPMARRAAVAAALIATASIATASIATASSASEDDPVRRAAGREPDHLPRRDLDRVVDELVVVGGGVAAIAIGVHHFGGHRRGDLPAGGAAVSDAFDAQSLRAGLLALDPRQQGGAVEVGAAIVDPGATHRFVAGVDRQLEVQRAAAGRGLPSLLVGL